jgi:hypothetical protein
MDLLEAKNLIAEALVESIFRRARYEIQPYRAGPAPLRLGREDFSPDFCARRPAEEGPPEELLVEVKYRPSIEQFLSVETQRAERSVLRLAGRQWPALYFVLVTDRPAPGRSCFQAIAVNRLRPGEPFRAAELRLFRANVLDHEELVRRIMGLLRGV